MICYTDYLWNAVMYIDNMCMFFKDKLGDRCLLI